MLSPPVGINRAIISCFSVSWTFFLHRSSHIACAVAHARDPLICKSTSILHRPAPVKITPGTDSVMVPIRRNWKRPAQLPQSVRMQAKMADPIRPSNGGPFTLMLGNQSRVLSHTDHQILNSQTKINQVHGIHHDLVYAEESGGADKLEKPPPQDINSEEKSSLQNHRMKDRHEVSEPNQENIIPDGKEMMLEFSNQHEEVAAAREQIRLHAHQKDPKGPCKSSKFHGVSFNSQNRFWEAYVWDPKKKRDPRKSAVIPKRERTGGQWYLGMYDSQEEAAQIHDKVFIKLGRYKGLEGTAPCPLNFPISTYSSDIEEMKECGGESTEEYIRRLRASYSVGFVQGKVNKRGVSGPRKNSGKYVAKFCYKEPDTNHKVNIHLGSFEDKVEAGKCYDKAAIFYKTRSVALTNFPETSYTKEEIEAFGRQLEAKRQKTRG